MTSHTENKDPSSVEALYKRMGTVIPEEARPTLEILKQTEKQTIVAMAAAYITVNLTTTVPGGLIYQYNGIYWEPVSELKINHDFARLDGAFYTATRNKEFIAALKAQTYVSHRVWNQIADDDIPFQSGILNLGTMKFREHKAGDFLEYVFPHEFNVHAECPTWESCLTDWFNDDKDKRKALQLFMGYLMLPHVRYKKALFLYGDSDCGKSKILDTMRYIVGEEHCAQLPMHEMDNPRSRSMLIGKKLSTCAELKIGTVLGGDGFKTIVGGGEATMVEKKYFDATQYRPIAKIAVGANDFPLIRDGSRGTLNRLIIIHMENVIPKAMQDRDLLKKLYSEVEGIICWSLQGARELIAINGDFPIVASGEKVAEDMQSAMNPAKEFVDEVLVYTGNRYDKVAISELMEIYAMFNGKPVARDEFISLLRRASTGERKYPVEAIKSGGITTRFLVGYRKVYD